MKKIKLLTVLIPMFFIGVFFTSCGTYNSAPSDYNTVYYDNPAWGPDYFPGTRYYYLPDIETYYDLSTGNFVYLLNGQWLFTRAIPVMYSAFDLYNGFVIIVDPRIYNPWMHHQYYLSHYPRYYYRDYYDYSNIPYVRGYNEYEKGAIFWKETERSKARPWDDRNLRERREFKYSTRDRQVQTETTNRQRNTGVSTDGSRNNTNTQINRQPRENTTYTPAEPRREPQKQVERREDTNYYGGRIGQPVREDSQMRHRQQQMQSTPERSSGTSGTTSGSRSSSGTTTGGRR